MRHCALGEGNASVEASVRALDSTQGGGTGKSSGDRFRQFGLPFDDPPWIRQQEERLDQCSFERVGERSDDARVRRKLVDRHLRELKAISTAERERTSHVAAAHPHVSVAPRKLSASLALGRSLKDHIWVMAVSVCDVHLLVILEVQSDRVRAERGRFRTWL